MTTSRPALLGAALAALALVPAGPAHAGGFGVPEVGVRRTGMGAVTGRPDEPNAVYHNPAGLVLGAGVRVYVSFGVALLDTEFQLRPWDQSDRFIDAPVDGDGYYPTVTPTRAMGVIPMVAVTADLWRGKLFGALSTYVPNGTGAKFRADDTTRYHLIDGYVISPLGQISAAYKVTDTLAVGAGFGMLNLRLQGKRNVYPILMGGDATQLIGSNALLELEGTAWAPTWNAGVLAAPIPGLTLGASVTARIDATLRGDVRLTYGDDARAPGQVDVATHETEQLLPWTFTAGANYDVTPKLELGAEVRYWLYRQYERQYTDVLGPFLIGELSTQKDYGDSWQIAGGGRVHDLAAVPGLEGMLGFHYDRTPAPTRSLTLDSPTFSHVGLHSGVRYQTGRYRLGLSYLHYWYFVPDIEDSATAPPSNIRGSGQNRIFTASFEATFGR